MEAQEALLAMDALRSWLQLGLLRPTVCPSLLPDVSRLATKLLHCARRAACFDDDANVLREEVRCLTSSYRLPT